MQQEWRNCLLLCAWGATLMSESIYLIAAMRTNDRDASDRPNFYASRELLLAAVGALLGFVVLPALVYFTGIAVLGAYGNGGLFGFYGNLWNDLATAQLNTWLLALLPYLALRVLWQLLSRPRASAADPTPTPGPKRRKEPTLS